MYQKFTAKFNSIAFTSILALCALIPLFFMPGTWSGLASVKGLILYVGVFIGFSFWLLSQFVDGTLALPRHKAFLALGGWVLFALLSALFSANVRVSLFGRGFVIDSFATTLVLALLTFLIASFARDQKKLVKVFLATFAGSVGALFLQTILYLMRNVGFVSKYLSHVASQGTLVGSWVDFAYFVTFTLILSLLMHEVLAPKGFFKTLAFLSMVLSLIILMFLNFKVAWVVTIVAALLVFVYKSSVERSVAKFFPETKEATQQTSRFPVLSFVTLIVGLFFFLSNASVGSYLAGKAGVIFNDIRPSVQASATVARRALYHDPIFGAGAGRYGASWNLYHPLAVNSTTFWNTTFDSGYSLLMTLLTTNGVLAILSLLTLLYFAIMHGFRLFNTAFPDRFSRFIAVTSLIMFLAFTALFLLASPGFVLVTYGFVYLGLLLGVSSLVGRIEVRALNYLKDPRSSFFAILLLVLATMGGLTAVYFSGNRFASIVAYNRALISSTAPLAQVRLDRALSLSQNDIYWRTRTALFVKQFTDGASAQTPDKTALQVYFTQAEQSARGAVAWDATETSNWLGLSQVYQLVAAGNNTEAYQNAKTAADEALRRSPMNPVLYLNEAQIALTQQDTGTALDYLRQAIAQKVDYLDAYVLRAQIRAANGEDGATRDELTKYIQVAPFDPQGYMFLGQAQLSVKNYQAALDAFNRAISLSPATPEPQLGAINALIQMGEKQKAIDALTAFKANFPDVTGVEEKVQELKKPAVVTTPTEEKTQ